MCRGKSFGWSSYHCYHLIIHFYFIEMLLLLLCQWDGLQFSMFLHSDYDDIVRMASVCGFFGLIILFTK